MQLVVLIISNFSKKLHISESIYTIVEINQFCKALHCSVHISLCINVKVKIFIKSLKCDFCRRLSKFLIISAVNYRKVINIDTEM